MKTLDIEFYIIFYTTTVARPLIQAAAVRNFVHLLFLRGVQGGASVFAIG